MFCITLALADNPVVWTLLFKNEEAARREWAVYCDAGADMQVALSDDFGQAVQVDRTRIAGALFEDLDKSMLAHVERGIHNARTQAKAQQIAINDPVLKTAAMTRGQGPAIFSPQGNGHY